MPKERARETVAGVRIIQIVNIYTFGIWECGICCWIFGEQVGREGGRCTGHVDNSIPIERIW